MVFKNWRRQIIIIPSLILSSYLLQKVCIQLIKKNREKFAKELENLRKRDPKEYEELMKKINSDDVPSPETPNKFNVPRGGVLSAGSRAIWDAVLASPAGKIALKQLQKAAERQVSKAIGKAVGDFLVKAILEGATNPFLAGLIFAFGGGLLSKNSTEISNQLFRAVPGNRYVEYRISRLPTVVSEKRLLDFLCQIRLLYEHLLMSSQTVSDEEKVSAADRVFSFYQGFTQDQEKEKITCLVCIIAMLASLAVSNPGGYAILLKKLLEAIRNGKISKAIARLIVRRLRRKGVPVSGEILDAIAD